MNDAVGNTPFRASRFTLQLLSYALSGPPRMADSEMQGIKDLRVETTEIVGKESINMFTKHLIALVCLGVLSAANPCVHFHSLCLGSYLLVVAQTRTSHGVECVPDSAYHVSSQRTHDYRRWGDIHTLSGVHPL